MALATKCPHCNTVFRVAHDQLKLRGGIVRCGACNEVFDGNAALVEPAPKPPVIASDLPASQPSPFPEQDTFAASPELPAQGFEPRAFAPGPEPQIGELADSAPSSDALPDLHSSAEEFSLKVEDEPAFEPDLGPHATSPQAEEEPALLLDFSEAPLDLPEQAAPASEPEPEAEPALDLDLDVELETAPETAEQAESDPFGYLAAPSFWREPTLEPEAGFAPAHADTAPPELHHMALPDEAEPHFSFDARREPAFELAPDEHLVAAPLPYAEPDDFAPEPQREEPAPPAQAPEPATRADIPARDDDDDDDDDIVTLSSAAGTAAAIAAQPAPAAPAPQADAEEPGFVKRDRRRRQFGKAARLFMAAATPLLLAAALAQGVSLFRNQLALSVPALKPALVAVCLVADCEVELPAQIDYLSIEQGELQAMADNTFSFATVLRNQSRTVQAWPHIELILNDSADKPVLRRVFAPQEYLPASSGVEQGLAARSEQAVKLYFEVAQVKASGYHIAIFYP